MSQILIVDDHPGMTAAVAALVRSEGYEPVVAHDGPAALDALRAKPIDLVILDVMMPGMSGLDVLREIRATHDGRPPVIMFSGNPAYRAESLDAGAVAFVLKVEAHTLLDLIDRHVGKPAPTQAS